MGYQLNLDRLGWTYIGLSLFWTFALASGMVFLWSHRQLPSVRMRKLPLLFAGVVSLHIYGLLCIVVYPVGAVFSCTIEFWVMSIFFPLGMVSELPVRTIRGTVTNRLFHP
jgi:hypothetical protein